MIKINCEQVMNDYSAYIDHELDIERITLVEYHLKNCQKCLKEVRKDNKLAMELRKIGRPDPRYDLWEKIMFRLELKRKFNK